MDVQLGTVLQDLGFWFRFLALVVNLTIQVLWISLDRLPFLEGSQTNLFLLTVPPFTLFHTLFLIQVFFEPIEPFMHRMFMWLGVCLFSVCGCVGVVNVIAFDRFVAVDLPISCLCCVNAVLLIADLVHLEVTNPLERLDDQEEYDWLDVINRANNMEDSSLDPSSADEDTENTTR